MNYMQGSLMKLNSFTAGIWEKTWWSEGSKCWKKSLLSLPWFVKWGHNEFHRHIRQFGSWTPSMMGLLFKTFVILRSMGEPTIRVPLAIEVHSSCRWDFDLCYWVLLKEKACDYVKKETSMPTVRLNPKLCNID